MPTLDQMIIENFFVGATTEWLGIVRGFDDRSKDCAALDYRFHLAVALNGLKVIAR